MCYTLNQLLFSKHLNTFKLQYPGQLHVNGFMSGCTAIPWSTSCQWICVRLNCNTLVNFLSMDLCPVVLQYPGQLLVNGFVSGCTAISRSTSCQWICVRLYCNTLVNFLSMDLCPVELQYPGQFHVIYSRHEPIYRSNVNPL